MGSSIYGPGLTLSQKNEQNNNLNQGTKYSHLAASDKEIPDEFQKWNFDILTISPGHMEETVYHIEGR
jgi:hypothetical protein